ncbi:Lymphocyte antigen 6H [Tupaia chinensis]|uniref:Lymphocyte antigen 6H n=1 Tax=Tupaia chinensis TaxID=246437 RepID=L9KLQ3_TUPCH|nr:Lymphocyte antigen 6H [Tupaia chinensis]
MNTVPGPPGAAAAFLSSGSWCLSSGPDCGPTGEATRNKAQVHPGIPRKYRWACQSSDAQLQHPYHGPSVDARTHGSAKLWYPKAWLELLHAAARAVGAQRDQELQKELEEVKVLLEKATRKRVRDALTAENSDIETEIENQMQQKSQENQNFLTVKSQLLRLLPLHQDLQRKSVIMGGDGHAESSGPGSSFSTSVHYEAFLPGAILTSHHGGTSGKLLADLQLVWTELSQGPALSARHVELSGDRVGVPWADRRPDGPVELPQKKRRLQFLIRLNIYIVTSGPGDRQQLLAQEGGSSGALHTAHAQWQEDGPARTSIQWPATQQCKGSGARTRSNMRHEKSDRNEAYTQGLWCQDCTLTTNSSHCAPKQCQPSDTVCASVRITDPSSSRKDHSVNKMCASSCDFVRRHFFSDYLMGFINSGILKVDVDCCRGDLCNGAAGAGHSPWALAAGLLLGMGPALLWAGP